MVSTDELLVGMILHLDPETLEKYGATCTCDDAQRVVGTHFFVCIAATKNAGTWLPLYSNDGKRRTKLAEEGRTGHPKWTNGTFFWHRDQTWSATHEAVVAAAAAGRDMSQAGSRNLLEESFVPVL